MLHSVAPSQRSHKPRTFSARDARRQELLDRQRIARQQQLRQARVDLSQALSEVIDNDSDTVIDAHIIADDDNDHHSDTPVPATQSPSLSQTQSRGRWFAALIQQPQWLTDIPADFAGKWLALPRPEGTHCLLIQSHRRCHTRSHRGHVLHCNVRLTNLVLPAGSLTMIEGVYNYDANIFYAYDCLIYNGFDITANDTEFRSYWLQSKLQEARMFAKSKLVKCRSGKTTEMAIEALTPVRVSAHSLQSVYPLSPVLRCPQDGLLFYHCETEYVHGVTPLVLAWRDRQCSRWSNSSTSEPLVATLSVDDQTQIVNTIDNVTVFARQARLALTHSNTADIASVNDSSMDASSEATDTSTSTSTFRLARFEVTGVSSTMDGLVDTLTCVGPAPRGRLLADSWDKILFQWMEKTCNTVRIDQLAAAVIAGDSVAMESSDDAAMQ